jgi:N-acetylglucosaminyldiphosphoundecaprenol N-acetyl-beta-D-mannosaminyltransferase
MGARPRPWQTIQRVCRGLENTAILARSNSHCVPFQQENDFMTILQARLSASEEPCVHVLGSRVHLVSVAQTVDHIERWIEQRDGSCRRVVATGFHGLLEAHKDPRLRSILNAAELWVPDGIAPVWAARLRGHHHVTRAPGADIMREFFLRATEKKYRSYFYGDTSSTLTALQSAVATKFPGHEIAGAFSPPFQALTPAEDRGVIERINAARPDVLWVALGMPKQDLWIYERLDRLRVPVAIGVGAAFAFIAGTVSRCPDWVGNLGFEWVYRVMKEPKKLWRRDLIDGPRFIFHAGMEFIRKDALD